MSSLSVRDAIVAHTNLFNFIYENAFGIKPLGTIGQAPKNLCAVMCQELRRMRKR